MYSVLVVDDDPAIREIFTMYLSRGGYTAMAVSGGRECLEQLKTHTPDLILLDMMMEPMDGWETLRAIRKYPAAGQVPVIIITGKQPVPEDIDQFGSMIEDFIVKPVEFSKLVTTLNRTIETARDLDLMTTHMGEKRQDPALLAEYSGLLRLVRITRRLSGRFGDIPWADRISLHNREQRLSDLHSLLGVPDRFLET
jgi:two-component system OmpR family response regulator